MDKKNLPFDLRPPKKIKKSIKSLFIFFVFYQIVTNLDYGILISSMGNILNDLNINFSIISIIMSSSSLGRVFSTFLISNYFKQKRFKTFLTFSIFIRSIFNIFYYFLKDYKMFVLSRFIIGGFQNIEYVYFDSWITDYIPNNNFVKISNQFSRNVGIIIGFYLGIKNNNLWRKNFLYNGTFLFFITLFLVLIPKKNFKINNSMFIQRKKNVNVLNSSFFSGGVYNDFFDSTTSILSNNALLEIQNFNAKIDDESDDDYDFEYDENYEEDFHNNQNKKKFIDKEILFFQMILNPKFFISLISKILYIFIYSTFLVFQNEYLSKKMNFLSQKNNFFIFFTINILSPLIGIFANNFLIKYIFSNDKSNKLIIIFISSLLSTFLSILIQYSNEFEYYFILTYLYFILLTFSLPSMIEINLNSTYNIFKKEAFIINNLSINFFGNFLGIFLYGFIYQYYKIEDENKAFNILMNLSWFYMFSVGGSLYYEYIGPERKTKNKKNIQDLNELNELRITRTEEVNNNINDGSIVQPLRISINDDEEDDKNDFDDNEIKDSDKNVYVYDDEDNQHTFNLVDLVKKNN